MVMAVLYWSPGRLGSAATTMLNQTPTHNPCLAPTLRRSAQRKAAAAAKAAATASAAGQPAPAAQAAASAAPAPAAQAAPATVAFNSAAAEEAKKEAAAAKVRRKDNHARQPPPGQGSLFPPQNIPPPLGCSRSRPPCFALSPQEQAAKAQAEAEKAAKAALEATEAQAQTERRLQSAREAAELASKQLAAREATFQRDLAEERARAERLSRESVTRLAGQQAQFERALAEERAKAEAITREAAQRAQQMLEEKERRFQMARRPSVAFSSSPISVSTQFTVQPRNLLNQPEETALRVSYEISPALSFLQEVAEERARLSQEWNGRTQGDAERLATLEMAFNAVRNNRQDEPSLCSATVSLLYRWYCTPGR